MAAGSRTDLTLTPDAGGHLHTCWDGNTFWLAAETPSEQARCDPKRGLALTL